MSIQKTFGETGDLVEGVVKPLFQKETKQTTGSCYNNKPLKVVTTISLESKYSTEYLIKYISSVPCYVFDLRGWPNEINRQEFDRLWDLDFKVEEKGFFWNCRHFSFVVRELKPLMQIDKEEIWKAIEHVRVEQLTYFMKSEEENFIQHCKYACNEKEKKDIEDAIHWAERDWIRHNSYRKALDLPEITMPEIFKPEYMNPLLWGE